MKEEGFDTVQPEQILEIVHRLGALERAHEMAETHAERAREIARLVPRDGLARGLPPRRRIRRESA